MRLIPSGHARGDRREHQGAFQSFAEYEDTDIHKRCDWARTRSHRIGCAMCSDPLPDDQRDHKNRGAKKTNVKSGADWRAS